MKVDVKCPICKQWAFVVKGRKTCGSEECMAVYKRQRCVARSRKFVERHKEDVRAYNRRYYVEVRRAKMGITRIYKSRNRREVVA